MIESEIERIQENMPYNRFPEDYIAQPKARLAKKVSLWLISKLCAERHSITF